MREFPDNFEFALSHTFDLEGGITVDTGGLTNLGVTQATLERYQKLTGNLKQVKNVTQLTKMQAAEIYYYLFWQVPNFDEVSDKEIAAELFDTGVNAAPQVAVRMMQIAYNVIRPEGWQALDPDGDLGGKSLDAIRRIVAAGYKVALLEAMNGEQYIHYKSLLGLNLIERSKKYAPYIRGWMKRLITIKGGN